MRRYFNYFPLFFLCFLFLLTVSCSDGGKDETVTGSPAKKGTASVAAVPQKAPQQASAPPAPQGGFMSISPREAWTMLQKRDDIIFLDVRTPQERAYAAIEGSTLVAFWDLASGRVVLPKEKPLLLVCAVGGRSYTAGKLLARQGYQEVYNLEGGIENWHREGLPLVRGNSATGATGTH
ncbi:MAG: rhodanese-like domain-containing protein [Desulfobulbaceae bacterium]|uniref:Rhodanese-like domain-containing protein n=1 Tax=Candidatus Desulfobia pelagia TaxID=2841692 RepID=A0A8J6NE89_9BACT|nr:rhodanese-like domain-containing protein [Candidatus Desulfobia pelagia]